MTARTARAAVFAAALFVVGAPSARADVTSDVARASELLSQWRYDEAADAIEELARDAGGRADVRYLRAEMAFLRGEYERARSLLGDLEEGRAQAADDLRDLIDATHTTTRGFERYTSERGNFEIYYPPGEEELLVAWAGEALERAYDELGDRFGYRPAEPVRVELLRHHADLSRLSTLTEDAIETSGTIALCKYNKLMAVSPRATVFGYPWLDTLVHEYVHYVVNRVSHNSVPIWLHEGLARFEQDRWRAEPDLRLSGIDEHLLAEALAEDDFIPFADMHPSMAVLPSQEAAALAFAEVYTMADYIHGEVGYDGIRAILRAQRDGADAQEAVADELGAPSWAHVERAWRRHIAGLGLERRDALAGRAGADRLGLSSAARGTESEDDPDDNIGVSQVEADEARDHARLGGMLRAHGRPEAAAAQYEKALAITGPEEPFVASRLSRTYLQLERHEEAIELAEPLAGADENDPTPATTLGLAHLALGETATARDHFEAAVRVSPFDPDVRCGLADAYEAEADDRAARERAACRELRR